MSRLKAEIVEQKQRIEELEQRVAEVKADTAASLHAVNVQTRYASRVQSVVRATPPDDRFVISMRDLIDADKRAVLARGK